MALNIYFYIFLVFYIIIIYAQDEDFNVNSGTYAGLIGGLKEQNPNLSEFHDIANSGLAQIDNSNGISSECKHVLKKILKANTQVVAGQKINLQIEICQPPSCETRIGKANEDEVCQICNMSVWQQKWRNFSEVTNFKCS